MMNLEYFVLPKNPPPPPPTTTANQPNKLKTNKQQKTQKSKPPWLKDSQTRITSEHNSIHFKISELILNYNPECILNTHADSNDWVDGWMDK